MVFPRRSSDGGALGPTGAVRAYMEKYAVSSAPERDPRLRRDAGLRLALECDPRWVEGMSRVRTTTAGGQRTEFVWTSGRGELIALAFEGPLGPGVSTFERGPKLEDSLLHAVRVIAQEARWAGLARSRSVPDCRGEVSLVADAPQAQAMADAGAELLFGSILRGGEIYLVAAPWPGRLRLVVPAELGAGCGSCRWDPATPPTNPFCVVLDDMGSPR